MDKEQERTPEQLREDWIDKVRAMGDQPAGPDTYWLTLGERRSILERHEVEKREWARLQASLDD